MLKQIINQDEESKSEDKKKEGSADSSSSSKKSSESKFTSKRSSPMTGSKNILSSDVEIRGKLRFSNDLIIDGRIEGEVNSEGDLTAGENAQIIGDIKTRSVVVFGKVKRNITVTDRSELKQNAELDGDVIASKLAIEEGAIFLGSSSVGKPSSISSIIFCIGFFNFKVPKDFLIFSMAPPLTEIDTSLFTEIFSSSITCFGMIIPIELPQCLGLVLKVVI